MKTLSICLLLVSTLFALCSGTTMQLLQSTYMGGEQSMGHSSTTDSEGNLYVAGDILNPFVGTFPPTSNFNDYGCTNDTTYDMFIAKFVGTSLSWYTCVSSGISSISDHIYVDEDYVYVGGRSAAGLPNAINTLPDGESGPSVSKLNKADGKFVWSYYLIASNNDFIVGLAPAPNGGIWMVGSTSVPFLNTTEGSGRSIPCSPDGDKELYLLGLNADGSFNTAHCYGGAKDEHIYESYYDPKSKKLYTPGAASSGSIAGVDITPYLGPSGYAFFLMSLNTQTGEWSFEGAETNPLVTRRGAWTYGQVTETAMDPSGILHFVGDLSHANKTSILVSFNPATKEFTSTLYNNTMISSIQFDSDSNMYVTGHNYGTPHPNINAFLTEGTHFLQVYNSKNELTFSSYLMRGPFKEYSADQLTMNIIESNGQRRLTVYSNMNWGSDDIVQVGPAAIFTERGPYWMSFLYQFSVSVDKIPANSNESSAGSTLLVGLFSFVVLSFVSLL